MFMNFGAGAEHWHGLQVNLYAANTYAPFYTRRRLILKHVLMDREQRPI